MKDKRLKKNKHLGHTQDDGSSSTGAAKTKGLSWLKNVFSSPGAKTSKAGTIKHLIQQKKFHDATKELIGIENTVSDDIPLQDIDSLYEYLEEEMSKVILKSTIQVPGDSLIQVIKAIKKREKEDYKILNNEDVTAHNQKTPRKWMEKWRKWIEVSESQQTGKALRTPDNTSDSCLSQKLCNLGKTYKNDIIHVIKNLSQIYPAEFNVCNLYAQYYHKNVMSKIRSITEHGVAEEDTYFLLCWIHSIYPQTILRDPTVQGHIDESKLESLLPPEMTRKLERNFLSCETNTLKTFFTESLNVEAKNWKDGKEPTKVESYYQSKLQINVPKTYLETIQRAAEISEEMSIKLAPRLTEELHKFLIRYQFMVLEYTQKRKQNSFKPITIANINCIWSFRSLLENENLRIEDRMKQNLRLILEELETLGYHALLQDMFRKLKSYFRNLHHGKNRKHNFADIMKYVKSFVSSLKPLCHSSFQVVIGKIHFQVVLEYVTRLMVKPVRYEDHIQLRTVASQMHVNANRIQNFFSCHESQETWLKPVIGKLAKILRLENQEDIINQISELAQEYTDISKEHIIAIFHMKGNIDRPQVESALRKIEGRRRRRANSTNSLPLFSLIEPFSSQWLECNPKIEDCVCSCLSRLYMTFQFTCNITIHFICKKINVDTPPKFFPHRLPVRSIDCW
ncbi:tumor necrosis factor alpha-induced protein 2-like isoform X1 [Leptodactylus fuscus]|uniref:tumor necrosis factor alpha-induced protein 2-like isoform X1 n=1 Tax=Leptodactylus fuscus TaxID=238119 RepID=UPI003F4E664A